MSINIQSPVKGGQAYTLTDSSL